MRTVTTLQYTDNSVISEAVCVRVCIRCYILYACIIWFVKNNFLKVGTYVGDVVVCARNNSTKSKMKKKKKQYLLSFIRSPPSAATAVVFTRACVSVCVCMYVYMYVRVCELIAAALSTVNRTQTGNVAISAATVAQCWDENVHNYV